MKNRFIFGFVLVLIHTVLYAQNTQIVYSEPERDDSRRTNFDIIGKVGGNILVYKNNRTQNDICIYSPDNMQLKQRVNLDFIQNDRLMNIDFVAYPDFIYAFYQYQKRGIIYCTMVKLDGNARMIGDVQILDTTDASGASSDNKIYTTINSDDKQRIMVFKINSRSRKTFYFTTLLYNANMELLRKNHMAMPMEERNDFFTDFLLGNDGQFVFSKFLRNSASSDYISKAFLVTKSPDSADFSVNDIGLNNRIIDELHLKIDNTNRRILLASFYYKQRRGNVEGLYLVRWDKNTNSKINDSVFIFTDEMRALAKSGETNKRTVFNDFFIKNMIIRKDGGLLLISESNYTSSRGGGFNRWDYLNWGNPWMYPYNYYWSPMYSPYYYNPYNPYSPWNRWNSNANTRYFADNVLLLSFDNNTGMEWSNVISKTQYDDETDSEISYAMMNTGGGLHFLYNQYDRRTQVLTEQIVEGDGRITRNPTLKNLDKGYEFMPRYAKQVSSTQMIVPCWYRNYLCFAKVEF